ncbi:hypothetical protein M9434_002885 [Picochlorum sp. BPE23]|nr:hypothetical protein M9434_002885 [Picochlorum sp. BPE23]
MERFRVAGVASVTRMVSHVSTSEISGALGDLGTFLPLVVGLTQEVGLDLGTTLLFSGIYNVLTGFLFDIPMPVQPMKTIAAVALSGNGLTIPQIMAAGIFVSACVLVLGGTGLMGLATRMTPLPVIRGMQLGVGLALSQKGFQYIWYQGGSSQDGMNGVWGLSGIFVGMFFIVFILLSVYNEVDAQGSVESTRDDQKIGQRSDDGKPSTSVMTGDEDDCTEESPPVVIVPIPEEHRMHWSARCMESLEKKILKPLYFCGDKASEACGEHGNTAQLLPQNNSCGCSPLPAGSKRNIPAAFIIVLIGIILSIAFNPSIVSGLSLGPSKPSVIIPQGDDWRSGILKAGLPQLPLTLLNSVISVTQLANEWFPDRYSRPGSIATSVGLMNLVGCWFGAMPSCHGAGGLAAQVRFGARWGTAPVLLGCFKVFLALMFGSSLLVLLQDFPLAMLGAMLVFSGIELASVAKGQKGPRGLAIMFLVASIGLATKNIAIGVVTGLCCAYILAIWDACLDGVIYLKKKYLVT